MYLNPHRTQSTMVEIVNASEKIKEYDQSIENKKQELVDIFDERLIDMRDQYVTDDEFTDKFNNFTDDTNRPVITQPTGFEFSPYFYWIIIIAGAFVYIANRKKWINLNFKQGNPIDQYTPFPPKTGLQPVNQMSLKKKQEMSNAKKPKNNSKTKSK